MENIDIDIDKDNLKNIDIDIDIDMAILENIDIDIDKGILQNIYIDIISYRLGFCISNTPKSTPNALYNPTVGSPINQHQNILLFKLLLILIYSSSICKSTAFRDILGSSFYQLKDWVEEPWLCSIFISKLCQLKKF